MAREFDDASSQYLSGSTPVTAAPITVACWAKTDDTTGLDVAVSITDTGGDTNYWFLGFRGDVAGDPIRWQVRAGGSAQADTTSGYTADTWHHLCGVEASSGDRRVYIDGGSKGTNNTGLTPTGIDTIAVAALVRTSAGSYLDGGVAELGVWNVALTDTEVALLAKGYAPPLVRPQSLVYYLPCVRDADEDIVGGISMSATAGPTVSAHPRVIYPVAPQVVPTAAAAAPAGAQHHYYREHLLRRRRMTG